MIKTLRNPNPVKFVFLHNSSYIEAWNVKFCSWLLFICKRMLYTLRVRVDFLFIFFFIGKLRLCNSGSQFNVSFQEEYMFLSGVYMSQNHMSESFFKFQNFPGRQATGDPPPLPKGIFQSNSLCLLHKHNSIHLPSQFRLYIYLMTALNFFKKFQNYLQNFIVVDMANSMISFFFLYLFQSVHKAFRSFSVFCHGLLAGCHRLKWLLNNMLAQVLW